ncbi:hypothetical protein D3C76_1577510 [compost metagenome]
MHLIAVGKYQPLGHGRIGHQGVDRVPDGHPHTALGDARQQAGFHWVLGGQAVEQAGDHIGGIGQ